jgi:hypothetical protein
VSEFKFSAPPLENLLQPILWRHYDPYNCAKVPPEMMGWPWMRVAELVKARAARRPGTHPGHILTRVLY